ncbi:hypothetical protein C8J56DRAFT_917247 [Mycena floridula]|nr:hypothetical protein C8J56DRAFT_917247 [Mycena floridula]
MVDETKTRKKRKTDDVASSAHSKRARAKGKLRDLVGMPLDVLLEIFSHLLPYDLLRMSRLNKDLRRVLISRSSITVWKSARSNDNECPNPPDGMSEPAWANLLFDAHCHFCLANGARNVEWVLQMRICKKCVPKHMQEFKGDRVPYGLPPVLLPAIPTRKPKSSTGFLTRDLDVVKAYRAIKGEEARKEFIEQRTEMMKRRREYAVVCEKWLDARLRNRSEVLETAKRDRYKAIVRKLRDAGWDDELAYMSDMCWNARPVLRHSYRLEWHKLVNQPVPLTDKIWQNIEGPLTEHMQEMRDQRLKGKQSLFLNSRKWSIIPILDVFKASQRPTSEPLPTIADICALEPVLALLGDPLSDCEKQLPPLLPDLLVSWRKSIVDGLGALTSAQEFSPKAQVELATTAFVCNGCIGAPTNDGNQPWKVLFYPNVVSHECNTIVRSRYIDPDDVTDPDKELDWRPSAQRKPWSSSDLVFNHAVFEATKDVVIAGGLDPEIASIEDMDAMTSYFACLTCRDRHPLRVVTIHGWKAAVDHAVSTHCCLPNPKVLHEKRDHDYLGFRQGKYDLGWETEADYMPVKWMSIPSSLPLQDSNFKPVAASRTENQWSCVHCEDTAEELPRQGLEDIKKHLSTVHRYIQSPRENVDFYRAYPDEVARNEFVIKASVLSSYLGK